MPENHPSLPGKDLDRWIDKAELLKICNNEGNCVIADRKVLRLHNMELPDALAVTAGERLKSFSALERMSEFIKDRRAVGANKVVVIGGGTVGDSAGLATHLVKRGMPLIQVPSTLLAAVDSSLGGKTAINSSRGTKNIFGAFHFAEECLLVEELWQTLEKKQFIDGRSEAVKMVICLDAPLLEKWSSALPSVVEMVSEGRRMKREVCKQDPYEMGTIRSILNFGHTTAHAIESLTHHKVTHGYAVAAGMRAALDIGAKKGVTSSSLSQEIDAVLDSFGLPGRELLQESLKEFSFEEFLGELAHDKKGYLKFVLLIDKGNAEKINIEEKILDEIFLSWAGENV